MAAGLARAASRADVHPMCTRSVTAHTVVSSEQLDHLVLWWARMMSRIQFAAVLVLAVSAIGCVAGEEEMARGRTALSR